MQGTCFTKVNDWFAPAPAEHYKPIHLTMMKPLYIASACFSTNCFVRLVLSVIDSSIDIFVKFGCVTGDRQIGFVQEYLCTQLPARKTI